MKRRLVGVGDGDVCSESQQDGFLAIRTLHLPLSLLLMVVVELGSCRLRAIVLLVLGWLCWIL